jgi:hypothetical protein
MERIIDSKLMLEILRLTGHNLGHLFSGGFPSYRARSSRPFKAGAWGLAK